MHSLARLRQLSDVLLLALLLAVSFLCLTGSCWCRREEKKTAISARYLESMLHLAILVYPRLRVHRICNQYEVRYFVTVQLISAFWLSKLMLVFEWVGFTLRTSPVSLFLAGSSLVDSERRLAEEAMSPPITTSNLQESMQFASMTCMCLDAANLPYARFSFCRWLGAVVDRQRGNRERGDGWLSERGQKDPVNPFRDKGTPPGHLSPPRCSDPHVANPASSRTKLTKTQKPLSVKKSSTNDVHG
ncbi:hypothetical protein B0T17DRAFT_509466 [Bombardia bombarda]|uniref:Uncharacterized protein n=1 Tax=Bombardia bombarda TaxID=252184 RepID=A0AA39WM39_9PEZI|nr:hypothetical protein B0T17DRAFT_509466 [Bombardia bombarda]